MQIQGSQKLEKQCQHFVSIFNNFSKGYAMVSQFRFKLEHDAYFHYMPIRPAARQGTNPCRIVKEI